MNSGGYGSSAAPRLPVFLCSEMNFRQIRFSETQGTRRAGAVRPRLLLMDSQQDIRAANLNPSPQGCRTRVLS